MRRIFAVLMALALLATACSSSGTNTPEASAPDNETSQNSENTPTESPAPGDKSPAAEVSLGSAPDELAYSNWTISSGTSFGENYTGSNYDYSWDTGLEEVEYSAPASNATSAEWIKVYSLSGGLSSGDYAGAAEFSTGEVADTYCLEYRDSTPHFDRDGNLHRISGAGNLTFSLTNGQVDSLEKIMDAYNDADYWNGSSYDSRLYDGIASAIWSVTDGHGLNNSVAQDIMRKVQDGTYSNNTSSLYWARSDNSGIQDQMVIVPPGNGPETAPPEIPFVEETSACQVQLFDFPFGDGLLTTLGVGEYNLQGDLGWLNDDIESIYVPEGMTITVSEHHNGGGWTKFREGPGTFEVHDDQVSWIKIAGSCSPSATPIPTTPPAPTPTPVGECHIDLFDFPNGQGELSSLSVGEYNLQGNLAWLNDDIESIYVPEGMRITVSEHFNGGGWTKFREGPGTFEVHDDQVSWIKVEGSCQPPATPAPAPTATSTPPTPTPTTPPTATPRPEPTPVPTVAPTPDPASIGDYVWIDADRDGVQDANESPLAGVSVRLYDENTVRIATTVTDANGLYLFDDLAPGDYSVSVDDRTLPDGFEQTWDLDEILDDSSYETLSAGEDNRDHDFGYVAPAPLASIGDYVWLDADRDGVQDASEVGIPRVNVQLVDTDGRVVATETTDANGEYLFEDLDAACYTVNVVASTLPADVTQTFDEDGTLDNSSAECLDPGEDDRAQDFGYAPLPPVSIGDYVWFDTNSDGVQDGSEDGIAGVTVTLSDDAGTVVSTDTTDANGGYLFEDLPAGCYTVTVDDTTLPAGAVQTFDDEAPLDHTSTECLLPGANDRAQDFGYVVPLASIGDYVWLDEDSDGVQDGSEDGIAGVTVTLSDNAGTVVSTDTTDANGGYLFEDLPAGCYTVTVDDTTLPAGVTQTFDEDGTLDDTSSECLDPGEDDREQDFGYVAPELASIGDFVWFDRNFNAEPDTGEQGLEDITLELRSADGTLVGTDVTDADGLYLFEDLPAGCYTVTVDQATLPAFVVQTYDEDGTLDHTSSECLDPGEDDREQDFGYTIEPD